MLTSKLINLFKKIAYVEALTDQTTRDCVYPPIFCWDKAKPKALMRSIQKGEKPKNSIYFIYLHLPFCHYRCTFCRQFSLATKNPFVYAEYEDLIINEAKIWRALLGPVRPAVIYLGGGTPTLFNLEKVFISLDKIFQLPRDVKINVESSLDALTPEKIETLRRWRIDRLVIGIQSLDKKVLRCINRPDNQVNLLKKKFKLLSKAVPAIGMELIAGLPFQTKKSFLSDIKKLIDLKIDSITLYIFRPTPVTLLGQEGYKLPRKAGRWLKDGLKLLKEAKYKGQAGTFTKNGDARKANPLIFEALNTKQRWHEIPLGISAYGSLETNDCRILMRNTLSLKKYKDRINKGLLAIADVYKASLAECLRRTFLRQLFCTPRLSRKEFVDQYGIDPCNLFTEELEILSRKKLIELSGDQIFNCCSLRELQIYSRIFYAKKILRKCERIIQQKYPQIKPNLYFYSNYKLR